MNEFSAILRQLIESYRKPDGSQITHEEIAVGVGVSTAYIRKLLAGKSKPGYKVIKGLSEFFDVEPNIFFAWPDKSRTEQLEELQNKIAFRRTRPDLSPNIGAMLHKIADLIAGDQQNESGDESPSNTPSSQI